MFSVASTVKCVELGKLILKFSDLNFKECDISSHDEVVQVDQFEIQFL